jgi:lipopolysaccharide transport system ATP-binding protein
MANDDLAIRVENLSKCYHIYDKPRDRLMQMLARKHKQFYREFWALKDVSFEVKQGETVGIIGRNGSGKSTLLQMICGTLNPTSGRIHTNGRIAALLELGSGFNLEFTGRENVHMNAALLGLRPEEIEARFDEIAAFADIGAFIEQPVKTYSSGMMVRLAFAVAINVDPQVLIVDEALSVGDELFQRKCFARIETIKQNGATILFVSHAGSTVVELCDQTMLLDSGEKLAMGAPKHILGKYQQLMYAPPEKQAAIREAIRASGNGGGKSSASPSTRQTTAPSTPSHDAAEHDPEEWFDPHLTPQSTVEYETHGACIMSPEIHTLSGRKVNCLKRGKTYRYTYKVRFDQGATNVRFGMLIKTITGVELGGAVSASSAGQGIAYQAPGTTVNVQFRFTCHLNPGSYFLNAGVSGSHYEADIYLHRVLDICMFKVMPISGNTATATIDFHCVAEVAVMSNSLQDMAAT